MQYMAERIPSVDDLAEAVTKEVMARISAPAPAEEPQAAPKTRKRKT